MAGFVDPALLPVRPCACAATVSYYRLADRLRATARTRTVAYGYVLLGFLDGPYSYGGYGYVPLGFSNGPYSYGCYGYVSLGILNRPYWERLVWVRFVGNS
ncbi:hypothetical protein F7D09_2119 [Bifidobacterium leontopitheci]|uniref:Uncharacterized protein n=1 Tax=Bifidobacterium leontopitheci TaxID=2650774 RepID=A0A6I1GCJ1_9BIFI|nr:hypothetical protein F7D09_2119 [Bifidobacterium leontopitheci]